MAHIRHPLTIRSTGLKVATQHIGRFLMARMLLCGVSPSSRCSCVPALLPHQASYSLARTAMTLPLQAHMHPRASVGFSALLIAGFNGLFQLAIFSLMLAD